MSELDIVILAAGLGKRMYSDTPKVLHTLADKSLLTHVVETSFTLHPIQRPIVICGHLADLLRHRLAYLDVTWIEQDQQLGTAHALQQALPALSDDHRVLVLYGDVPLISAQTLKEFIASTPTNALGIITTHLSNPTGYGRIIRDANNKVTKIIEEKDATDQQRAIQEINSGIYLIPANCLSRWLPKINNHNTQKEYYLTDILSLAAADNIEIVTSHPHSYEEILGVNDRLQLSQLERTYQRWQAEKFLRQGVTLLDPNRFDLRGEAHIGKDVTIDVNVILEGKVTIGNHCVIGPNTILRNVKLADHVEVRANSLIDGAEIDTHCVIGPFARIRPGTEIASFARIGNFVEVKNSLIDAYTKINHLSYIGDSEIGKRVNIGAGTITCNYDGVNKHKTIIADEVFIGSNSQLVAPVTIGEKATIGAGSTITRDAPANQLTVARAKQLTIKNWQRPQKEES
jgi:bifunctional UDP-N-acetylglucosamine pyrophosphorylase/glucosamine-1-phosphate N-acetyltransferase